jgi:N-acylneuraminate cytidylyltransferase
MSRSREILALILARGGSKSVPRKNLRLVAGKPLLAHSIEQAKGSRLITRVMVSTEDPEIAEVARQWKAEVPFLRPAELAQDETPDLPVFQHALVWLQAHERYEPDVVGHLRPTAPVRRVEVIDLAIQTFLEHPEADSLRSVSMASQSPYKMWVIGEDGCLEPVARRGDLESWNLPRQLLPRVYWQNGYLDVIRPEVILQSGSMTGTRILPFVIDEPCIEIDYEEHLQLAERLIVAGTGLQTSLASERLPS